MPVVVCSAFSQTIGLWHDFYLLVGTGAVTLLGLLFVAVSLNLRMIAAPSHAALRAKAVLTFNSFLYILTFSLVFLVPDQSPAGLGLPLLLVGGYGTITLTRNLLVMARAPNAETQTRVFLIWRVVLPIAWSVALLTVSATVIAGATAWLWVLVPVFVARLIAAVRNAWDLMLSLGMGEAAPARDSVAGAVAEPVPTAEGAALAGEAQGVGL